MVEKTVDPPPAALRLYFPPWWGRKEEKEPKKAMKGTVMAAFLGCQSFVGGEEVSFGGGVPGGPGGGPWLLVGRPGKFPLLSNIINAMGKSHFTSFLINNLCRVWLCVPRASSLSL